MGMLDAVVLNAVNHVKAISNAINIKMDTLVGAWADQLTTIRSNLTNTRIAYLDYLNTLEARLTTVWATQLTNLRTAYTDTRAGYLDLVNTLNTRLSDSWATQVTNLRAAYTDTRASYLDLVNTLNTRLSSTWAAKLDSLRTAYTDTRATNLDAIPESRMAKLDQLRAGITDTRAGYLDLLPTLSDNTARVIKTRVKTPNLCSAPNGGFSVGTMINLPANVFTQVLSITGTGALTFFGIGISAGHTMYYQLWVDGILIQDTYRSNNTSASKLILLVGGVTGDYSTEGTKVALYENIAFTTSVVVLAKPTITTNTSAYYAYDLY